MESSPGHHRASWLGASDLELAAAGGPPVGPPAAYAVVAMWPTGFDHAFERKTAPCVAHLHGDPGKPFSSRQLICWQFPVFPPLWTPSWDV